MKVKCVNTSLVKGYGVVHKGDIIELDESEVCGHIVRNFVAVDGGKPIERVDINSLSDTEIVRKLKDYGVTTPDGTKREALLGLLLTTMDNTFKAKPEDPVDADARPIEAASPKRARKTSK